MSDTKTDTSATGPRNSTKMGRGKVDGILAALGFTVAHAGILQAPADRADEMPDLHITLLSHRDKDDLVPLIVAQIMGEENSVNVFVGVKNMRSLVKVLDLVRKEAHDADNA